MILNVFFQEYFYPPVVPPQRNARQKYNSNAAFLRDTCWRNFEQHAWKRSPYGSLQKMFIFRARRVLDVFQTQGASSCYEEKLCGNAAFWFGVQLRCFNFFATIFRQKWTLNGWKVQFLFFAFQLKNSLIFREETAL